MFIFLTTLVAIDTDCIDSYKSNYHTITITTAPNNKQSSQKIISSFRLLILFLFLCINTQTDVNDDEI